MSHETGFADGAFSWARTRATPSRRARLGGLQASAPQKRRQSLRSIMSLTSPWSPWTGHVPAPAGAIPTSAPVDTAPACRFRS